MTIWNVGAHGVVQGLNRSERNVFKIRTGIVSKFGRWWECVGVEVGAIQGLLDIGTGIVELPVAGGFGGGEVDYRVEGPVGLVLGSPDKEGGDTTVQGFGPDVVDTATDAEIGAVVEGVAGWDGEHAGDVVGGWLFLNCFELAEPVGVGLGIGLGHTHAAKGLEVCADEVGVLCGFRWGEEK